MSIAAQEQAVIGQRGGGHEPFFHRIFAQELELVFHARDENDAILAGGIKQAIGDYWGGEIISTGPGQWFGPERAAGRGIQANDFAPMAQEVNAALVFGW